METHASLDDPTPTAGTPTHHKILLMLISPDGEQCGEDLSLPILAPNATIKYFIHRTDFGPAGETVCSSEQKLSVYNSVDFSSPVILSSD